jgi:glutathione peroxidase
VPTLSDFSARSIAGEELQLSRYDGQVVLVVNTASQCGFTPQYEGLEALYEQYEPQGLVVLGFPCDQFGHQEPGADSEIDDFCKLNFGVTFPLFSKIDVNGETAHPLYQWLREEKSGILGDAIKWNFTKFLVGRDGQVIQRYAPTTTPDKIAGDVEAALSVPVPR